MSQTRTLMLGWEFPPFISGGLGTACYGLTKAMDALGIPIVFVMPGLQPIRFGCSTESPAGQTSKELQSMFASANVRFRTVQSSLQPYGAIHAQGRHAPAFSHCLSTGAAISGDPTSQQTVPDEDLKRYCNYGPDIHAEVHRYAARVANIARAEAFDIVHAHDWMTFPAGILVAKRSGRPLVVHVHSTEFDRSGERVNQNTYDLERRGMHAAARVIAVSNYTKNMLVHRYAVPPDKVEVVYNGAQSSHSADTANVKTPTARRDKVVLFLGRITMQKGPEYFLLAARKVLDRLNDVKFIMAGDGDMLHRSIELAAHLRIAHKVFFPKFLRGDDVHKAYRMADLYVMPSVSEPFGIAPLEALQHEVPVLISKQSGIGEALSNALKVDFWDVNELANKMVAALRYSPLRDTLRTEGRREMSKFRWEYSAARVLNVYRSVLQSYSLSTS